MKRLGSDWVVGSLALCGALAWGCGESEPGLTARGNGAGAEATETNGGSGAGTAAGGTKSNSAGSSAKGGTPAMGDGGLLADWPADYSAALCQLLDRCWPSYSALLPAAASCEASLERRLRQGTLAALERAIVEGRVEHHAEKVKGCLALIANSSCEAGLTDDLGSCAEVFVGQLKTGDMCTLDAECGGGAQCLVEASCPGTCGPRFKENEPCTSLNRCEDGLSCMLDADRAGVCTKQAPAGGLCSSTIPCTSFYFCSGLEGTDPEATGTCEPRNALFGGARHDSCSLGADGLCEVGLSCVLAARGQQIAGTCEEHVAAGAACQYALPDQCLEGEYCRIGDTEATPLVGTCTKNPELGQECAYDAVLSAPCAPDQHCSALSKNCEQSFSLGEACAANEDCLSHHCVEQKCVALLECELD